MAAKSGITGGAYALMTDVAAVPRVRPRARSRASVDAQPLALPLPLPRLLRPALVDPEPGRADGARSRLRSWGVLRAGGRIIVAVPAPARGSPPRRLFGSPEAAGCPAVWTAEQAEFIAARCLLHTEARSWNRHGRCSWDVATGHKDAVALALLVSCASGGTTAVRTTIAR